MRKSMPWSKPPAALRYGAAIAALAAAVAAGTLLQPALAPVVSLLLCGVLFAAWFGGFGPGLLAVTLGLLAFDFFFLPPLYSLAVQDYSDVVRLIAFAIAALFVVALSARQESTAQSLRRAYADLQAAVRDLERANASLRDENAERQRAEDRLLRSEAHLAEAQRLSHTGSAVYNETEILYWSEESSRIWEFDPRQGIPSREAVWQRIHPDDLDKVNANIEHGVREKRSFVSEFRIMLPGGAVKHIEATNHPVFSASGELLEIVVTGLDVTERKRAEQALRESEAQLAQAQRELR
jgi:PAS domain S-box-containing protein